MASAPWPVDRLVGELELLAGRGLPRGEFFRQAGERVKRVVPADALCWHTLDPETRLMTSDAPDDLLEQGVFTVETATAAGAGVVASEYLRRDVNTFASLARRRVPVGILSDATRGHPEQSARYREVLLPAGIPFELRAAFVTRGRCWGAVHIARRQEAGDFGPADAAALARAAGVIAEGIRTSVRFDAARHDGAAAGGPGLVVLDSVDDVELITAPARELLEALGNDAIAGSEDTPPIPVLALASYVRMRGRDDAQPAVVAVPTSSGWITLHASLPDGRLAGRVAIVLERSPTPHAAALRLESYGVTPREREVAALLAHGLSNAEIAARLVLSPFTVQDHVKKLYEKTGVASRQELVARVFLDDYLPQIAGRAPLTAAGTFAGA